MAFVWVGYVLLQSSDGPSITTQGGTQGAHIARTLAQRQFENVLAVRSQSFE